MIVVDDAGYVDLALDTANIDRREIVFAVINADDASGDAEAHWLVPYRFAAANFVAVDVPYIMLILI